MELLGGELSDVSNGLSRSLLESNSLESLVHVKGVVSGSVLELLLSSFFGTCHLKINLLNNRTESKVKKHRNLT